MSISSLYCKIERQLQLTIEVRIILRYTTETVAKYWDNSNYRIFIFKMDTNGNLIIISSNDSNSNLYGWSLSSIGKSLYDVMDKERADRLHLRYYEWKKSGLNSYIAYFDDVAWETTIEIVNDTMFGIGKKIQDNRLDLLSIEKCELYNRFHIQSEDFIVLTLIIEDESIIIETVDTNFINDFPFFLGKDISSLTFYCSNIIDKGVYNKCVQTKMPAHFVEKYVRNGTTLFFDIMIYPYCNDSKIFVYAKKIDEYIFNNTQKTIDNMHNINPETGHLCICEISYMDKANPYIIGCNNFFKKLIEENNIKLPDILQSAVFQKCTINLSTTAGDLIFQNTLGEAKKFKINVSHLPKNGSHIFIVVLSPEDQYIENINCIFANLSNREKEVLTYVADGLTNRYIANKLSITEGTVKRTIYNGYKKLGVCSRIELLKIVYNQYHV